MTIISPLRSALRSPIRSVTAEAAILSWGETLAWWDSEYHYGTTWDDRVNGYAMVPSGSPAWSATSFNGSPGVTLNGTDAYFTLAAQPFPSGSAGCEIFVVCQQDLPFSDGTSRNIFAYGGTAGVTARQIQRRSNGATNLAHGVTGDNTTAQTVGDPSVAFSSRHLIRWRVTPTTSYLSVDGNAEVSVASIPATATTRCRIGANTANTAGAFFSGISRDTAVFAPLTSEQRAYATAFFLARRNL